MHLPIGGFVLDTFGSVLPLLAYEVPLKCPSLQPSAQRQMGRGEDMSLVLPYLSSRFPYLSIDCHVYVTPIHVAQRVSVRRENGTNMKPDAHLHRLRVYSLRVSSCSCGR